MRFSVLLVAAALLAACSTTAKKSVPQAAPSGELRGAYAEELRYDRPDLIWTAPANDAVGQARPPHPGAVVSLNNSTVALGQLPNAGSLTVELSVRNPRGTIWAASGDLPVTMAYDTSLEVSVGDQQLSTDIELSDDDWHHISLTRTPDGAIFVLVDGRREWRASSLAGALGAVPHALGDPNSSGQLYAAAIYGRALREARLRSHALVFSGERVATPRDLPVELVIDTGLKLGSNFWFGPHGQYLLTAESGSEYSDMILYDLERGHEVQRFPLHQNMGYPLAAIGPGHRLLASPTALYDMHTGALAVDLPIRDDVGGGWSDRYALSFSSDGRRLYFATSGGRVETWETTGTFFGVLPETPDLADTSLPTNMALDAHDKTAAITLRDKSVLLRSLDDGRELSRWHWHDLEPTTVAFLDDGRVFTAASTVLGQPKTFEMAIWKPGTRAPVTSARGTRAEIPAQLWSLYAQHDRWERFFGRFHTIDQDSAISIDTQTGEYWYMPGDFAKTRGHTIGGCLGGPNPDRAMFVTASREILWLDYAQLRVRQYDATTQFDAKLPTRSAAVECNTKRSLAQWPWRFGLWVIDDQSRFQRTGVQSAFTISADATRYAWIEDGTIHIQDTARPDEDLAELDAPDDMEHSSLGHTLAVDPARDRLTYMAGRTLRTIDFNGRVVSSREHAVDAYGNFAYSPNGRYLVSSRSYGIVMQDGAKDGESPHGTLNNVYVEDVETGARRHFERPVRHTKGNSLSKSITDIAVADDGRVLTHEAGGTVRLWSVDEGWVRDLGEHFGATREVLLDPSRAIGMTITAQNGIRTWKLDTGDWLHLELAHDTYFLYDQHSNFATSPSGIQYIHAVRGLETFSSDQIAPWLNRPDRLLADFGTGDEKYIAHMTSSHKRRIAKLSGDTSFEDALSSAPLIDLQVIDQQPARAELEFSVIGSRSLSDLQVWVDGVPVHTSQLDSTTDRARVTVALTEGKNLVEAMARDGRGVASLRVSRTLEGTKLASPSFFYVGLGVSTYEDPAWDDLDYAATDAEDLATHFSQDQYGLLFDEVNILTLTEAEVRLEALEKVEAFLAPAEPEDTVVVFIAGHGMYDLSQDEPTYYYCPGDVEQANVSNRGIPFSRLEALVDSTAARKKLMLIDTCNSGEYDASQPVAVAGKAGARGITPRASRGFETVYDESVLDTIEPWTFERDRFLYRSLERRTGTVVFSASRGREMSYEDNEWENGAFTEVLLAALQSQNVDQNGDGWASVRELDAAIPPVVSRLTGNLQHPTIDRDNIRANIRLPISKPAPRQ
ncbi:MAG: caspase family protein [Myxococcota bacterium]